MRIFLFLILSFLIGFWIGLKQEKEVQGVHPIALTIHISGDILYADYGSLQIYFEISDEIFKFKTGKELTKFIEGYTAQSVIELQVPLPDNTN